MQIANNLTSLKVLFNDVKEVYYYPTALTLAALATELNGVTELPVLEDGVNFNSGEADKTEVKLTTGATWTTRSTKGDSDISLQVASIDGTINEMFMKKVANSSVTTAAMVGSSTYTANSYSLSPKKVTGALILPSDDRQTVIVLPSVEMYASFVAADGDNPAYFSVKVTPVEDADGSDIYLLEQA